jgi:hypothetical protein
LKKIAGIKGEYLLLGGVALAAIMFIPSVKNSVAAGLNKISPGLGFKLPGLAPAKAGYVEGDYTDFA